jgi:hypothetical protein
LTTFLTFRRVNYHPRDTPAPSSAAALGADVLNPQQHQMSCAARGQYTQPRMGLEAAWVTPWKVRKVVGPSNYDIADVPLRQSYLRLTASAI